MLLTGQNQFTRGLSGSYKMTNGSHVRKLFLNGRRSHQRERSSWVNGNTQSSVGEWRWRMSAMSDVFYSSFHICSVLFCFITCKSDPRLHFFRVLALTCPLLLNFVSPTPNFHLLPVHFYRGSRQILSRRQHAPNKRCALKTMCAW